MNQPTSRCHSWVDDLVRLSEIETALPQQSALDAYLLEDRNPQSSSRFGDAEENMDVDMGSECGQGSVEEFPGAAKIFPGERKTFLGTFDSDTFSNECRSNPYYPFASRPDWEFGLWLIRSGLSLAAVDSLLSLGLVSLSHITGNPTPNSNQITQIKDLPISFRTARQLRSLVELLPTGPKWQYRIMQTAAPTKSPVRLFYRDTVECLKALFQHPLFHDKLDLVPRRVYRTAERLVRVYSEWMTSDGAWAMQVRYLVLKGTSIYLIQR